MSLDRRGPECVCVTLTVWLEDGLHPRIWLRASRSVKHSQSYRGLSNINAESMKESLSMQKKAGSGIPEDVLPQKQCRTGGGTVWIHSSASETQVCCSSVRRDPRVIVNEDGRKRKAMRGASGRIAVLMM